MRRLRPARIRLASTFGAAALCLLLLAACEDPSGVGLTVLDPGENDPRARSLPAETAFAPLTDVTGAFLTAQGFSAFRTLAGRVDDPLFGTTSARAYLDLLPPQNLPEGFRDRPIEQAILRLNRTYVYGDTTMPTRLDLRQISEEWNAVGAEADTLFPVMDELITSFDVAAGDSLVEVALPAAWIAANDTTLRSTSFSTLFHGFQLSPGEGASAVYGFTGASTLELISAEDTVRYGVSELFSGIEGPETAPTADDLLLLQDGTSRGLELLFDLDPLGQSAINAVFLRVNADTAAAATNLPAGFARPFARQLALYGFVTDTTQTPAVDVIITDSNGSPVPFAEATLNEETQTYTFASSRINEIFQDQVLSRAEVDGFLIGFSRATSSLDVAPLVQASAGCGTESGMPCEGPRATIFLIPADG
ncbi:MAG: hypothetical protein ABJF88_17460 [Rhodothermales bacterium]